MPEYPIVHYFYRVKESTPTDASNSISIREAGLADTLLVAELCSSTFYDTYASFNTKEDTHMYLELHFNPQRILEELREKHERTFLAYAGTKPAGYARVSPANSPEGLEGAPLEIVRIYVTRECQKKGIGLALIEHCRLYAEQNGYDTLWLGVWEHNPNAIAFYEKLGFTRFGEHGFLFGTDLQNDYLMKLRLTESASPTLP